MAAGQVQGTRTKPGVGETWRLVAKEDLPL